MEAERERHTRVVDEQNRIDQQSIADQNRKKAELEAELREQANRIAAARAIQGDKGRTATQYVSFTVMSIRFFVISFLEQIAAMTTSVPAAQTHSNNITLNDDTFHIYGTMNGIISGHVYHGSILNGGINGSTIDIIASGSVTIGGNFNCRNLTIG